MATPMLDKLLDEVLNEITRRSLKDTLSDLATAAIKLIQMCRLELKMDVISVKDTEAWTKEVDALMEERMKRYATILSSSNVKESVEGYEHIRLNLVQFFKECLKDLGEA